MSLLLDKDRLHRHTDTLTTATQTERLTTLCRMQGYLGYLGYQQKTAEAYR